MKSKAKVLSETVGNALMHLGRIEALETANLLNVSTTGAMVVSFVFSTCAEATCSWHWTVSPAGASLMHIRAYLADSPYFHGN